MLAIRVRPRAALLIAVTPAAVLALCAVGCSPRPGAPAPVTVAATATTTTSLADQLRQWETVAGDHFTESSRALREVAEASAGEDEAALTGGCTRLHDTNTVGLQRDLPTPDRKLTEELQRMIDDINTATHACLRFVTSRADTDAANYREYLARAVEHLNRAKEVLDAGLAPK